MDATQSLKIISEISHIIDMTFGILHDLYEKEKRIGETTIHICEKALLMVFKVATDAVLDQKIQTVEEALHFLHEEIKKTGVGLDLNFIKTSEEDKNELEA